MIGSRRATVDVANCRPTAWRPWDSPATPSGARFASWSSADKEFQLAHALGRYHHAIDSVSAEHPEGGRLLGESLEKIESVVGMEDRALFGLLAMEGRAWRSGRG